MTRRTTGRWLRQMFTAIWMAATWACAGAQTPAEQPSSAAPNGPSGLAVKPQAHDPSTRRPIALFVSRPMMSHVELSPDGTRFAALFQQGDDTLLVTRQATGGNMTAALTTDNKEFHFNWVRWASDERLLVSVRFASRRDFVATAETRLLSIKPDGTGLKPLIQNLPSAGSSLPAETQQFHDQVVDWMHDDRDHILLALSEPGRALPAVYKVNVETGARHMVKAPERDVYTWISDARHRVRVGVRTQDKQWEILGSNPDGSNWRTLWRFSDLKQAVWPLGFGVDPQELYVRAPNEGRMAVFSVRLDDPALPRRLRLAHPQYDVKGTLIHSPATGEVLGLRETGTENAEGESRGEFWSPVWQAMARDMDKALPPKNKNRLRHISQDEQRYLVYSSGNGHPGQYYLGDRQSGQLSLLGETYPELPPATLVGKRAMVIQARDGLKMTAYLTLPAGRAHKDGGPPLPMVLLPNQGPTGREDDDFDTWTEFLADRGYAVLQVNFRGSTGYGHDFQSAGLQRWGLEMQDDLTDATQWAIQQGVADSQRVCIVGVRYGGYAALMGAVKTPALYRCAASFAGVTDLLDLIEHKSNYVGGRAATERLIGKAWDDRERLRATSPALLAERIEAPVLLVHGTADHVVPVEQSQAMAKALRRAGRTYRYIEQEGGDHGLSRFAHRLEFFKALEIFLDENLQAPRP